MRKTRRATFSSRSKQIDLNAIGCTSSNVSTTKRSDKFAFRLKERMFMKILSGVHANFHKTIFIDPGRARSAAKINNSLNGTLAKFSNRFNLITRLSGLLSGMNI